MKKLLISIIVLFFVAGCDTLNNRNRQISTSLALWANSQQHPVIIKPPVTPPVIQPTDTTVPLITKVEIMKNGVFCDITGEEIIEYNWFKQPVSIRITANEDIQLNYFDVSVISPKGVTYNDNFGITWIGAWNSIYLSIRNLPETCLFEYWTILFEVTDMSDNVSVPYTLKIHIMGE